MIQKKCKIFLKKKKIKKKTTEVTEQQGIGNVIFFFGVLIFIVIRDSWSRDDPAFVMIQLGFILAMCLAYSFAFHMGFWNLFKLIFNKIIIEFLLVSIIFSTFTW